jgi:hypothetical protein
MKPLIVVLLLAISVQAQSLADAARKERERRVNLKPVIVITGTGEAGPSAGAAPPAADAKPAADATPSAPDPVKAWNDQVGQLRKRIQEFQDQETALQLKQNDLTNQVNTTVIDQTTKDKAQVQLGLVQGQLAAVRADLDIARKTLDQMQLEGPPGSPKK